MTPAKLDTPEPNGAGATNEQRRPGERMASSRRTNRVVPANAGTQCLVCARVGTGPRRAPGRRTNGAGATDEW